MDDNIPGSLEATFCAFCKRDKRLDMRSDRWHYFHADKLTFSACLSCVTDCLLMCFRIRTETLTGNRE